MSGSLDVNEFLQPKLRIDAEVAVLVQTTVGAGPTAAADRNADEGEAPLPSGP